MFLLNSRLGLFSAAQFLELPLTFRHRAGVSPYTSAFAFAETCVFGKQLPGPFHCDLISEVPLLPKLRGQLAEFLNNPSPAGLRILSSSTCVGLRYGRKLCTYTFSRHIFTRLPYFISVNCRPGFPFPVSVTICVSVLKLLAVTEFPPSVHRLRLSASP